MLYHPEVFFPQELKNINMRLELEYSRHAKKAANSDRYGRMCLPSAILFTEKELVEVEMQNGVVVKWVVRLPYNKELDTCFAVTADGKVKTVWFNKRTDTHKTLDAGKYAKE